MTEPYSFQDTDALLASLSSSSAPTLSPSDLGNFSSSGKSSSYGLSPDSQNLFGVDGWDAQDENTDSKDLNEFLDFNISDDPTKKEFMTEEFGEDGEYANSNTSETSPLNYTKNESYVYGGNGSSFGIPFIKTEEESSPESHRNSTSGLSSSRNKVSKPQKKDRSSHNVIEKKYRTNINDKIGALRDAVPALRMAAGDVETTIHDLDGLSPASKLNKGVILTKATEYIKHLERKNQALCAEAQQLRQILQNGRAGQQAQIFQPFPQQQQQQQGEQMYPSSSQHQASISLGQFQPAADYSGQPINMVSAQQPQYQMGLPGKVIMGGLATMAGQQMFANDFDYRGLSAFPLLSLPQFQIFMNVSKMLLLSFAIVYIFYPSMFDQKKEDKKSNKITGGMWYELFKELVFIKVESKKTADVSDDEVRALLNKELLSLDKVTYTSLFFTLLKLHTFTPSFEVSFGKLILAKLLLSFSDFSIFFNLNSVVEKSLQEISNQKASDQSLRYFFKELQSSKKSTQTFRRFVNLISKLPINHGCIKDEGEQSYSSILKDESLVCDYKKLIVSFRANELFYEVLLKYIRLTFQSEKLDNEEIKETKKEIWDLLNLAERLSPERSVVQLNIKIFKSVLNEKYVDGVLKMVTKSADSTEEVKSYFDDEIYDSEREEEKEEVKEGEEEEDVGEEVEVEETSRSVDERFQKIFSSDLSNALAAATVLKYIRLNQQFEAETMLGHIKSNKDEITLLSFISLFKVIQKYPKSWLNNEVDTIEPLTCQLRLWVGDASNRSFDLEDDGLQLKREISDQLVEVGVSFSEVH